MATEAGRAAALEAGQSHQPSSDGDRTALARKFSSGSSTGSGRGLATVNEAVGEGGDADGDMKASSGGGEEQRKNNNGTGGGGGGAGNWFQVRTVQQKQSEHHTRHL